MIISTIHSIGLDEKFGLSRNIMNFVANLIHWVERKLRKSFPFSPIYLLLIYWCFKCLFSIYLKQALSPVYKTKTFLCLGTRIPSAGPTDGSVVQNLPVNAGEAGDTGLIPESGRSPGGRNGNPFQYACLENCMHRGAWWPAGSVKKSWTWLSDWACTHNAM